jgi:hypothetical protein
METFDVVQEFQIVAEGSRGGGKRQALTNCIPTQNIQFFEQYSRL